MTAPSSRALFAAGTLALAAGCAVVAGLEDKTLLEEVDASVDTGPVEAASDDSGTEVVDVVLAGLGRPWGVAVDVGWVYFAEETRGTVSRLGKRETTPVVMANGLSAPRDVLLDAQFVYWRTMNFAGDAGIVFSYPVQRLDKTKDATATPQNLWREGGDKVNPVRAIALYERTDGTTENLLFLTRDDRVQRKPRNNEGNESDIANAQNLPTVLAVDADWVYWVVEGDYAIRRQKKLPAPPDAAPLPPPETIHASPDRVSGLALAIDDENLYWLDQLGRVLKKKKDDAAAPGAASVLASSEATTTGALAIDRDNVYWTNGDRGTVWMVPKSGDDQSKRLLGRDQAQPRGIAVDTFEIPHRVYWTTETSLVRASL